MTATSESTSASSAAAPPRSIWFVNRWFDALLIIGTPLLVWPLVMLAEGATSAELLTQLILVTATGHYFATFVRTYGDRQLFARFKARLLFVPALVLLTCVYACTNGYADALLLTVSLWGWWHWVAQAFGFARIYDAKVGSFRPLTAFLDKALVVTWFFSVLVLDQNATANFLKLFFNSGVTVPGAEFFAGLRAVTWVAVVGVTSAYVLNLAYSIVRGEPVSWVKQWCHCMTIGFYTFAYAYMPNFFVSYVLYELFHDIQYFAIVWVSSVARVRRPDVRPWMARMFQPGWSRAMLFVGVMLAIGSVDATTRSDFAGSSAYGAPTDLVGGTLVGLFLTAALMHYYFDGFIWKMRESVTRGDFGVAGGRVARAAPGIRHGVAWGAFFVPFLYFASQTESRLDEPSRVAVLASVVPDSVEARTGEALRLASDGRVDDSIALYESVLEVQSPVARVHLNYGYALDLAGRLDEALDAYRAALDCSDAETVAAEAHVAIAAGLWQQRQRKAARAELDQVEALGGSRSDVANRLGGLSEAVRQLGQEDRSLELLRAYTEFVPDDAVRHNDCGMRLLAADRLEEARSHFRSATRSRPDVIDGFLRIAEIEIRLDRPDEARAALEKARAIEPTAAELVELERRLGGR